MDIEMKEISAEDLVMNLWIAFERMRTDATISGLSADELADKFKSGFNAGNNPHLYWSAVRDMSDGLESLAEVASILKNGSNISAA